MNNCYLNNIIVIIKCQEYQSNNIKKPYVQEIVSQIASSVQLRWPRLLRLYHLHLLVKPFTSKLNLFKSFQAIESY